MQKLFVLISKDLPSVAYQGVQGAHAVAQWLLNNKETQTWNNQTLVFLEAENLIKWKQKLELRSLEYTEFIEPDLNNKLTSLAVLADGRQGKLFKKLKLIGSN